MVKQQFPEHLSGLEMDILLYKENVYPKMSLKKPKTLRKCSEILQPRIPELQFLKTLTFPRAL